MISGIVLAAGTGSRFGGTKQLAELDGSPLVLHAVTALREGGVDEIVVVTGHDADAVEAVLPAEVRTVRNASFREGQSTSLAAANSGRSAPSLSCLQWRSPTAAMRSFLGVARLLQRAARRRGAARGVMRPSTDRRCSPGRSTPMPVTCTATPGPAC